MCYNSYYYYINVIKSFATRPHWTVSTEKNRDYTHILETYFWILHNIKINIFVSLIIHTSVDTYRRTVASFGRGQSGNFPLLLIADWCMIGHEPVYRIITFFCCFRRNFRSPCSPFTNPVRRGRLERRPYFDAFVTFTGSPPAYGRSFSRDGPESTPDRSGYYYFFTVDTTILE